MVPLNAALDDVKLAMPYVSSWLTVGSRHIATGSAAGGLDSLLARHFLCDATVPGLNPDTGCNF